MSPTQPIVTVRAWAAWACARCGAIAASAAAAPPAVVRPGAGARTIARTASAGTRTAPAGSSERRCEALTKRGIAPLSSRDEGRPGLRPADAQSCFTGCPPPPARGGRAAVTAGSVVVLGGLLELRPRVGVVAGHDGRVRARRDAVQLADRAHRVDR